MFELPTESEPVRVVEGDCRERLSAFDADSFDSVVTDPPYGLAFMGRGWDHGVPGVEFWRPVLRVLRPGGYMLAFGGTRTFHRLACAVEDAGFEVRDTLCWLYGTGFPKGQGCLKPAWEPILLCRKPGPKVLPLGIDGCRVPTTERLSQGGCKPGANFSDDAYQWGNRQSKQHPAGRWPANVLHDGSDEVLEAFAAFGETRPGHRPRTRTAPRSNGRSLGTGWPQEPETGQPENNGFGDTGTAARFFYCAKAGKAERAGSTHPTVKPLALMRWLVRLVTPAGGLVLDPFCGSGSTLVAAVREGFRAVGIDSDAEPGSCATARRRVAEALGTGLFAGGV